MKKTIVHIGGALLMGGMIVLGAFVLESRETPSTSDGVVVAAAPARKSIEITDEDADGVPDWEESLSASIFETISTPTSSLALGTMATYTPPTSFTGKFAEAFFQDFMEQKMQTGSVENPDELVKNAMTAIENNTKSKVYTPKDLAIIPATNDSLHTYGNRLMEIQKTHSVTGPHELAVVKEALEANDSTILKQLVPITLVYRNAIAETLAEPVPDTLVEEHIALLNAYEAIHADIMGMGLLFSDSLIGLAHIQKYRESVPSMTQTLTAISKKIRDEGVYFSVEEIGAKLYEFEQLQQ